MNAVGPEDWGDLRIVVGQAMVGGTLRRDSVPVFPGAAQAIFSQVWSVSLSEAIP
jgi:hypothetical protein